MWQVIGASAIGTSHIRSKTPCQDAHGFRILANNCIIAASADGLGSALRADEGATLAVNASLDILAEHLNSALPAEMDRWLDVLLDTFMAVRKKLEETAQGSGAPLRDFSTTLMIAAATEKWLAVGHIGDGAVVARFASGEIETVSPPLRGEFANETTPITAKQWMEFAFCNVYQARPISLALFTDGLQNQALNTATGDPYKPFFAPFFDAVSRKIDSVEVSRELRGFLESERVCAKTDDDKTLVVAGWVSNDETLPAHPSNGG